MESYLPLLPERERSLQAYRDATRVMEQLVFDGIATPVFRRSPLLAKQPGRFKSFLMASALITMLLGYVALIPILFPAKLEVARRYFAMNLVPSSPKEIPKPIEVVPPVVKQPEKSNPEAKPKLAIAPKVVPSEPQPIPVPRTYAAITPARAQMPTVSKKQNVEVVEVKSSDVAPAPLPTPALEVPSLVKPREAVQTGLFGLDDPGGASKGGHPRDGVRNVNLSGSGSDFATTGSGKRNGLSVGGFDASEKTEPAGAPRPKPASTNSTTVKLLFKPRPKYTDEARAKGIEGDVILNVTFTASGHVEVLGVIHGLGFGLDEQARTAAQLIQFTPATRDGAAVDVTSPISIVFRIAS